MSLTLFSLRNDVRYTASLLPYSHRNINLPGQMPLSSSKLNKILDLERARELQSDLGSEESSRKSELAQRGPSETNAINKK